MTEETNLFPDLPVPDRPSLTPIGDHLSKRYMPPRDAASHYPCSGNDPGCYAIHPDCAYAAGWREALAELAAELKATGEQPDFRSIQRGLRFAAALAEKKAGKP